MWERPIRSSFWADWQRQRGQDQLLSSDTVTNGDVIVVRINLDTYSRPQAWLTHPPAWKSMCVAWVPPAPPHSHAHTQSLYPFSLRPFCLSFFLLFFLSKSESKERETAATNKTHNDVALLTLFWLCTSPSLLLFLPTSPTLCQLLVCDHSLKGVAVTWRSTEWNGNPAQPTPFFFCSLLELTLQHFTSSMSNPPLLSSPALFPYSQLLLPWCYVLHMLWWLLLWTGEMIQAAGMHGRAAAGHCTCSAKKQADWCMFGKSFNTCVFLRRPMHFRAC